ncbi:chromosome segregation ATPase [Rhizobium aethiopicum]|uniref:hypothetical protein n=1 Tax=Rhizobium aethiopicum TaxID=1138170 RepID=UPI001616394E|nr:hypothetical protein [Rhizobium aethiopicum]MBB4583536.1 chromosome segregation ATPase [Rhizobium aethiopicum]
MSATIHEDDVFEKARDRAREEHLRKAIDREVAAHRSLCQHYNKAIERIAELEDNENRTITGLETKLRAKEADLTRLAARMQTLKARQLKTNIVFACLSLVFLASIAYRTHLMDVVLLLSK